MTSPIEASLWRQATTSPLTLVLLVAVVSRILVAVAMSTVDPYLPQPGPLPPAVPPFVIWDARWYLAIAHSGYHASPFVYEYGHPDFSFFPLWPLTIVIGSMFGLLDAATVAPVLAQALFLAAVVVVYRLLERHLDVRTAQQGAMLLVLAPGALVFSLAYSESLYVLLAAGALLVGVASRGGIVLVILASLCRLVGPALSAAALPDIRTRPRLAIVALMAGPATFLAWCAFIWHLTGDPLGYLQGSPAWWSGNAVPSGIPGVVRSLTDVSRGAELVACLIATILAAICLVGGVWLLRRVPALGLYVLATLAATVLAGHWTTWPRLLLAAFPALVILTRSRAVFLIAATSFGITQLVFARIHVAAPWVP